MPFNNLPGQTGGGNPFTTGGGLIGLIIGLVLFVFMLYVWGRIFHKAGYSGWLALLLLIPLVNLVLIVWFAFAHWPTEHDAMMARAQLPPGFQGYGQEPQAPPAPAPERGGYQPPGAPTPQH